MKPQAILPAIILGLTLSLMGCKNKGEEAYMEVRMTDDPALYDQVNVEIEGVEVHWTGYSKGVDAEGEWIVLDTRYGIYDLLQLQNEVDTVLSPSQPIPAGKITQVRIILGDDNTVVVDGQAFPLLLSSQDETGLKINVNRVFDADESATLLLDFDAGVSVIEEGNGSYRLKPVIHLID